MIALLIFFGTIFQSAWGLENSTLLKCQLHYKKEIVELRLDAVGKSFLSKTSSQDHCDIELSFLSGSPKAHIPGFDITWKLGECSGTMKVSKKDFFNQITMKIETAAKTPTGLVQWLRAEDVQECVLQDFRAEDLMRNVDLWLQGKWGQK